jgi:UDP-N-acetylglucosamine:LPS N-acetylglucosamine transferase
MKRNPNLTVVCDRGGHLHNALKLLEQMEEGPQHFIVTWGPEFGGLNELAGQVHRIPYLFSWWGKFRFLNPLKVALAFFWALYLAVRIRPKTVVSTGATNVVFFCYWAKVFGAKILHVECMNQVVNPSLCGRMLYPIAEKVFVQWKGLEGRFGPKAQYSGWVL